MSDTSIGTVRILEKEPRTAVIELGSHVMGGTDALNFTSKLNDLGSENVTQVVVDLHNVEVMNSSGLGMLTGSLTTMKKQNIGFALAAVPDKIMNLLKMTHLDRVFSIYPNVDEAVK